MIRARCAYEVCKGSAQALHKAVLEDGEDVRRIYAEDQVICSVGRSLVDQYVCMLVSVHVLMH